MSDLHRLITEYDPENDAGPVTWADIAIVRAMLKLSRRIDLLEQQPPEPHAAGLVAALRQWVRMQQKDIEAERQVKGGELHQAHADGRASQLAALVAFLDGYLSE